MLRFIAMEGVVKRMIQGKKSVLLERNDSHRQIDTSINRFEPNWLISW